MGFLTDHVSRLRRELLEHPLDEGTLYARASGRPPARDFLGALGAHRPSLIAEVKRASPSAGAIAEGADPATQAGAYARGGAACISVLTEGRHFGGTLADLEAVRRAVEVPVLRKDFVVHPAQVIESRASGADAVLLITAALSDAELTALLAAAGDLGLGVLLEAHSDEDIDRALATDAPVIGVNARDLETLEVDTGRALAQLSRVPTDRVCVFESGVKARVDVEAAAAAGASAILVGESLMRAADPEAAVRELLNEESPA